MVLVKDVMDKKFKTLRATDSIHDAVKLLTSIPEGAVPVVAHGKTIVGEISQSKLLLLDLKDDQMSEEGLGFMKLKRILAKRAKKVKDLMNVHEVVLSPEDDVSTAAKFLYEEELSTIPVVDSKDKLVGVITDICVLKHYKKILGKKKKKSVRSSKKKKTSVKKRTKTKSKKKKR